MGCYCCWHCCCIQCTMHGSYLFEHKIYHKFLLALRHFHVDNSPNNKINDDIPPAEHTASTIYLQNGIDCAAVDLRFHSPSSRIHFSWAIAYITYYHFIVTFYVWQFFFLSAPTTNSNNILLFRSPKKSICNKMQKEYHVPNAIKLENYQRLLLLLAVWNRRVMNIKCLFDERMCIAEASSFLLPFKSYDFSDHLKLAKSFSISSVFFLWFVDAHNKHNNHYYSCLYQSFSRLF